MLRRAEVQDAHAIAVVHVRSWQAAYRGLVRDDILDALSVERRAEFWAQVIPAADSRGQRIVVAESPGAVTGFVCTGSSRDAQADPERTGELQAIYCLPEHWSTGLGHALHEAALEHLKQRGHADATLWVVEGNERAIRFYERHGWARDGAKKHEVWDGAPLDEIRMRASLA